MKFQIDFDKKTIKVESNVNLGELVEKLQTMIPEWKTWKLETNVTINWSNPVTIIKEEKPSWPWNQPYYTSGWFTTYTGESTSITYNVEA